jgi:energy-coupling factor transport system permease protein
VTVPLLIGSLRGTATMAMVADARGFGANRKRGSLKAHKITAVDIAGYTILVVLVGTAIILNHFHIGARPY